MRYEIGIFGRAGKIEGVLCCETGLVLRQTADKTENFEAMLTALVQGIPLKETAVFAGLDEEMDFAEAEAQIRRTLPGKVQIQCENFATAILGSCFAEEEDGAVLHLHITAGAAAQAGGVVTHTGGCGAPNWSPGGSFWVGAGAIADAKQTGNGTCLVRLLEKALGMPLEDAQALLHCAQPEKIASYAKIVRYGFRLGDAVAKKRVENTLEAIFAYVNTVSAVFTKQVPLYVLDVPPEDRENIKAAVCSRFAEKFDVLFTDVPPVFGAVCRAARMHRIHTDAKFKRYFMETYAKRSDATRV